MQSFSRSLRYQKEINKSKAGNFCLMCFTIIHLSFYVQVNSKNAKLWYKIPVFWQLILSQALLLIRMKTEFDFTDILFGLTLINTLCFFKKCFAKIKIAISKSKQKKRNNIKNQLVHSKPFNVPSLLNSKPVFSMMLRTMS